MKRQPSNLVVFPLEMEDLCLRATENLQKLENLEAEQEDRAPRTVTRATTNGIFAVIKIADRYFALNNEGVGDARCVCSEHPLEILFCAEYDTKEIQIEAKLRMNCFGEKLTKLLTRPPVRLEDFIRRFGTRLESNYELWRKIGLKIDQLQTA